MMEKGGGPERCLVRIGDEDAQKNYRAAGLLHLAVLNDQPEMVDYLAPFMKKCVNEWVFVVDGGKGGGSRGSGKGVPGLYPWPGWRSSPSHLSLSLCVRVLIVVWVHATAGSTRSRRARGKGGTRACRRTTMGTPPWYARPSARPSVPPPTETHR